MTTEISITMPLEARQQLRQFISAVYEMTDCRFMARVKVQDHSVKMERLDDGQYRLDAPSYDWEDFQSFLTTFRRIAISVGEPVYFFKILNLISRYGSTETRERLKELKQAISPIIAGKVSYIRFGTPTVTGRREFTSYELLDAIVNGWVFHSDSTHEDTVAAIRDRQPWQFILLILTELIIPIVNSSVWLVNISREEGFFGDAEFPKHKDET